MPRATSTPSFLVPTACPTLPRTSALTALLLLAAIGAALLSLVR